MKKQYLKPVCEVFHIDPIQTLAMSGWTPDSDDSEFGAPVRRNSAWDDMWDETSERVSR